MGPVERAIRQHVSSGDELRTPGQGKPFKIGRIDQRGVVLLLGQGQWETPIPWECWEQALDFIRRHGSVRIGSKYDTSSEPNTLDGFLKKFVNRATAGWVAVVLERAGVVRIDRRRPATVWVVDGFGAP